MARTRSSVADVGGGLRNWATNAANAAIQRAPSRLYKLNEHQHTSNSSSPLQSILSNSAAVLTQLARKSQSFRDLKTSVDRGEEEEEEEEDVNERRKETPLLAQHAAVTTNCCGPEFIVKSNLAPHVVVLSHQPKKVL